MQRNWATKIRAKWESGLTAVWLKWDPPVDGFLNGPSKAIPLPAYYVEVFHVSNIASDGLVALYCWRSS